MMIFFFFSSVWIIRKTINLAIWFKVRCDYNSLVINYYCSLDTIFTDSNSGRSQHSRLELFSVSHSALISKPNFRLSWLKFSVHSSKNDLVPIFGAFFYLFISLFILTVDDFFFHSATASEMQRLPRKQIGRTAVQAGLPSAVNLSRCFLPTAVPPSSHIHNKQSWESSLLPVCADPLKACATGSECSS